jgi:hypothetical protein
MRTWWSLVVGGLVGLSTIAACGSTSERPAGGTDTTAAVPAEFVPACGHPGTVVTITAVPVTVFRASCDVTGVEVHYGLASAVVPATGKVERNVETLVSTDQPTHLVVTVDDITHDVTITG